MTHEEVCEAEALLRAYGYIYLLKRCELGIYWNITARRTPNVWPYSHREPSRRLYDLDDVREFLQLPSGLSY